MASRLGLTDIELDALFWGPDWTEAPQPVFRGRIESAMAGGEGWVVHGNYNKVRDLTWGRADTLIWLDYSLPVVLWRVTKRSVFRIFKGEKLWSGNRESVRKVFFSRDSIILWALQTYSSIKRQYEALIRDKTYAQLRIVRFKSPKEASEFLANARGAGPGL